MPTEGEAPGRVPLIVVDTNLFVAWLFRPQAPGPAALVDRWRDGSVRLCASRAVWREVRATLARLPVSAGRRREILAGLEDPARTVWHESPEDSGFRTTDPDDDKFLHLALAVGADALVTSDHALLEVDGFPVPILKSGPWLESTRR